MTDVNFDDFCSYLNEYQWIYDIKLTELFVSNHLKSYFPTEVGFERFRRNITYAEKAHEHLKLRLSYFMK